MLNVVLTPSGLGVHMSLLQTKASLSTTSQLPLHAMFSMKSNNNAVSSDRIASIDLVKAPHLPVRSKRKLATSEIPFNAKNDSSCDTSLLIANNDDKKQVGVNETALRSSTHEVIHISSQLDISDRLLLFPSTESISNSKKPTATGFNVKKGKGRPSKAAKNNQTSTLTQFWKANLDNANVGNCETHPSALGCGGGDETDCLLQVRKSEVSRGANECFNGSEVILLDAPPNPSRKKRKTADENCSPNLLESDDETSEEDRLDNIGDTKRNAIVIGSPVAPILDKCRIVNSVTKRNNESEASKLNFSHSSECAIPVESAVEMDVDGKPVPHLSLKIPFFLPAFRNWMKTIQEPDSEIANSLVEALKQKVSTIAIYTYC